MSRKEIFPEKVVYDEETGELHLLDNQGNIYAGVVFSKNDSAVAFVPCWVTDKVLKDAGITGVNCKTLEERLDCSWMLEQIFEGAREIEAEQEPYKMCSRS